VITYFLHPVREYLPLNDPGPGPARINCTPVSVMALCWEGERGMVIGDVGGGGEKGRGAMRGGCGGWRVSE